MITVNPEIFIGYYPRIYWKHVGFPPAAHLFSEPRLLRTPAPMFVFSNLRSSSANGYLTMPPVHLITPAKFPPLRRSFLLTSLGRQPHGGKCKYLATRPLKTPGLSEWGGKCIGFQASNDHLYIEPVLLMRKRAPDLASGPRSLPLIRSPPRGGSGYRGAATASCDSARRPPKVQVNFPVPISGAEVIFIAPPVGQFVGWVSTLIGI